MTPSIRDAIRAWARTPVVALVAALSLTLGIAATTTLYSLVDHLLLRQLPVPAPNALVVLGSESEPLGRVSFPLWQQVHERRHLYESAFASSTTVFNVAPQGEVENVQVGLVSGGVFRTLRLSPAIGRLFDEGDDVRDGGPDGFVAVITHHYWERRFGGAPDTIGRTLVVEGTPFTIVGVTPRGFRGLRVGTTIDVLLPLWAEPHVREFSFIDNGRIAFLSVVMRLAPGVPAPALTAALRADQAAMREATIWTMRRPEDRDTYLRSPIRVSAAADGGAGLADYYRNAVTILFGLAVLVLLACCGNVATVLIAHGAARSHALGIRAGLGASRWDGPRQMLTDGLVLALPAAAAALLIAHWAGPWVLAQWHEARLDGAVEPVTNWRVWCFASIAGVLSGMLSGLGSAWRSTRHQPLDNLRGHASRPRSSDRLQHAMVTGQLAFSVVVAVASALLLQSYDRVASAHILQALEQVVAVELRLARSKVPPGAREVALNDVHRRVAAALPGARISEAMAVPFRGGVYFWGIEPSTVNAPTSQRMAIVDSVSASHFDVLGAPVLAGRTFDARDSRGSQLVCVVNRTFALRFLASETRVPQRIQADTGRGPAVIEVVGVIEDVPYENPVDAPTPALYLARTQFVPDDGRAYLLIAPPENSAVPIETIRQALASASPGLSYEIVRPSDSARQGYARERMLAIVAAAYVAIAVTIAGLGVFGVMSHTVATRRRDFGIRLTLGALPYQVAAIVVGRASRVAAFGTLLGLMASWWVTGRMGALLVTPDVLTPRIFVAAGAATILLGIAAAWWPAWRAARLNPAVVLRSE